MRKRHRRSLISAVRAKKSTSARAERSINARAASRARRVRRHSLGMRAQGIISAFFEQVRKGSTRAIAVLCALVLVVVGLPVILLVSGGKERPEAGVPVNSQENEILVLDGNTFSASGQGALGSPSAPTPTPDPHPENGDNLTRGMTAPVVVDIQDRLMELGYMDWDEPTDFFGPNTREAVQLFQRQHNLETDGAVGPQTYSLLMGDDAQKYMITIENEGTDVQELQNRLRELGYINKATSYFGTETEAAVKKFQKRNGLPEDGMVGEATREMLYSEDAKADYIERGEASDTIKKYQQRLKDLGYLTSTPDGTYGRDTENAVKEFQARHALIADGYLGPTTISELMSKNAQANAIVVGMNGSTVEKIQKRLIELGYLSGKADGRFGSNTEQAVCNFQNQHKLTVDGKVGKKTLNLLMSDKAQKSDGSSTSKPSSSGSSGSSGGSSGSTVKISGANVESFIAVAESKLGSKYVRGAKGPNSFDCSGFVYWCLNQVGVKQSYMTSAKWQKTGNYQRISGFDNLQRGDVISFKGHVGIYLGGGKMIDASSSQGKIRIATSIQSSAYWKRTFVCGYRIF